MTAATLIEARELDARSGDGIEVRMLWYPASETVVVSVFDVSNDEGFELLVEPHECLDAFRHPFAYAAHRGVPYETPRRASDALPTEAATS